MDGLSTLTNEQIKKGIEKCKERIFGGNAWPPDLSEFMALVYGQSESDYDAAFFRCLNKDPQGRVEQWVYEKAYFNIRSSSDEQARRMHKRFMKEAEQLEREGKLKLNKEELLALPPNSVKNMNDLAREKWEEKHGKTINPRLQKIMNLRKSK